MSTSSEMLAGFFPATEMPDSDWWEALWPDPGKILSDFEIEPGMTVIDLCCGDGLFTVPLAHLARLVIAIDLDPEMVRLARTRAIASGAGNCEFIVGDAYDIAELASEPADLVLMANTFHGVPDKERLGRAVAAVLEPNGRFVVVNWHRSPREETTVLGQPRGPKTEMRMEPEEVAAAVEGSGLRLEHVIELPPYNYGAILREPVA